MAYEDYEKLLKDTQKCYRSELINNANLLNELQQVYRKAKAYDDINKCLVEIFKQEEPLYLADEYERGLYNAYYEIAGIIQGHMERADDERWSRTNSYAIIQWITVN